MRTVLGQAMSFLKADLRQIGLRATIVNKETGERRNLLFAGLRIFRHTHLEGPEDRHRIFPVGLPDPPDMPGPGPLSGSEGQGPGSVHGTPANFGLIRCIFWVFRGSRFVVHDRLFARLALGFGLFCWQLVCCRTGGTWLLSGTPRVRPFRPFTVSCWRDRRDRRLRYYAELNRFVH